MRSVNQNHHLYVVTSVKAANAALGTTLGTIQPIVSGDTKERTEKDLYFNYVGRDGVTRSDFIPINQISYVKFISADDQRTPLKKVTVTLDEDIHTDENDVVKPIPGTDYVLNIAFQQFYGLSPEDTYVKTVAVHATAKMDTAAKFYAALENELNASFSREVGADATSNPYLTFSSSANGLVIEEKEQPWSLGKYEAESLVFDVFPSTINLHGDDIEWGVAENGVSDTTVPNSKKMADLEWFTFSERADFYHGMGYPNNFDFTPMVLSGSADGYDALEIHFAYQGSCEDIQKSEKDITLIAEKGDLDDLVEILEGETYLNRTIMPTSSGQNSGNNG